MNKVLLFLKAQPTAVINVLQVILGILISADVLSITEAQTGVVLGLVSAAMALVLGIVVQPFTWSLITGIVQAVILFAAEFGWNPSEDLVANIYTLTSLLGGIFLWFKNTPETKLPPSVGPSPAGV